MYSAVNWLRTTHHSYKTSESSYEYERQILTCL